MNEPPAEVFDSIWVWQIYGQAKPGRFRLFLKPPIFVITRKGTFHFRRLPGERFRKGGWKSGKRTCRPFKKSNKTRFGVGLGRIFGVATTQKERNIYIYIFEWFCSSIVALDYELKNVIPCSWNATTVNNTPASPYLNIPCWLKICSRNVFTCGSCSDLTSCLCLKQDLHKKTLAFTWE